MEDDTFLQESSKRSADDAVVLDKFAVVASESKETTDFLNILWCWTSFNIRNLAWVCGDTLTTDDVTLIPNLTLCKSTLRELHLPLVL